jgi:hypothetical protein
MLLITLRFEANPVHPFYARTGCFIRFLRELSMSNDFEFHHQSVVFPKSALASCSTRESKRCVAVRELFI